MRFIRARLRSWRVRAGIVAVVAAAAALVVALPALSSVGSIGTAAGFEDNDGNLAADAAGINFDWNSFTPTWTGTAPYRTGSTSASGWTFNGLEDAQKGNDTGFSGGVKQDDECPSVKANATAANKDDLKRVYFAHSTVGGTGPRAGHVILTLGWVRIPQNTTSSSAHVAFEFNQGTTSCGSGSGGLVHRSTANGGDMLIVYNFEGGSGFPTILLERWINSVPATGSPACEIGTHTGKGLCWSKSVDLTAAGLAEANVDRSPGGPTSALDTVGPAQETLGDSEFGEAGIDLTSAGIFTAGQCTGFGTADAVSRTSGDSGSAAMDDLVGPGSISITNCGSLQIEKVSGKGAKPRVGGATFTITPSTGSAFDVTDNGTGDQRSTAGVVCIDNLPLGTTTVVEKTAPTGFVKDPTTYTVSPSAGTTCSTRSVTDIDQQISNTPLSKIEVKFTSLGTLANGDPATTATIDCRKTTPAGFSTGTQLTPDSGAGTNDQVYGNGTSTLTADDYTCHVLIDP